jgi:hypothetical protein
MKSCVGTLGPAGTNSELACKEYILEKGLEGEVNLYSTPELSIQALINHEIDVCILCVVYPKLNEIVFRNLEAIHLSDIYLLPTYAMVVAGDVNATTYCSHPAPIDLIENGKHIEIVNSNAEAARLCKSGYFGACVTTKKAAEMYGLNIIKDYGEVPMGWAVFTRKNSITIDKVA